MTEFNRYVLKRPVISDSRLQKIAKKVLDESFIDRERALDAYKTFLKYLETNSVPDGIDVVKGLVESLKLAQTTLTGVLRLVDLMMKLNLMIYNKNVPKPGEKGKGDSLFSQLEEMVRQADDE